MEHLACGLFFKDEDIPKIRNRATDPRYSAVWDYVRNIADKVVAAKSVRVEGATCTDWYYIRNNLLDLALTALITEEPIYIETVNQILWDVAQSDMSFWQGPEYPNRPRTLVYHGETRLAGELETATICMGVCTAYDWCYSYLREDVKQALLTALREKGQMLLHNSVLFQSENWVMNHLCVLSAGLTLCCFTLRSAGYDVDEDIANARNGLNLWMDKLEYDGSYGESYHYWGYPTNCLFFGLQAFKTVENAELENTHRVRAAFDWALNNQVGLYENVKDFDRPVAVAVNNYDCPFVFQMEAPEALLYAKFFQHPVANWYIDHFLIPNPPRPDCLHHVWHTTNAMLLALDDPEAPRRSPADYGMPLDRYFSDTGFVYMRDSWEHAGDLDGDMVFSLQSGGGGRSCSHEHYDKNSFSLYAYGEYLINDPGHSCYRGQSHHEFDTFTKAHNTLCISGENQSLAFLERGMLHDEVHEYRSFRNQAQVVGKNFNPHVSYIASDAHRCYEPYLKDFTRHIWFVRPDYFVILDRIDTRNVQGDPMNGFNINNLDGKTEFELRPNGITAHRPKADVSIDYAFPANITFQQSDSKLHIAYHIFTDCAVEGKWGSAVRFTPQPDGTYPNYVDYLYVICPGKKDDEQPVVKLFDVVTKEDSKYAMESFTLEVTFRGRTSRFEMKGEDIDFHGAEGEYYRF